MSNTAEELIKRYIERIENINDEIKSIQDDRKDVFLEAKSNGFDVKALKAVIKLRKQTKDEREQEQAIIETYTAALGME